MELESVIDGYIAKDPEIKPLWEEHALLSKQVEKLETKPFLNPSEEIELKELKKRKLDNKTTLQSKIDAVI